MNRYAPYLIALALSAPFTQAAPVPPPNNASAADSYAYARGLRDEGQRLGGASDASADNLRLALIKYQAALDYLDSPAVMERAAGSSGLRAEPVNLLNNMAMAYAKLGMKDQALSALERLASLVWLPVIAKDTHSLNSPVFDAMRTEPRFIAVLNKLALPDKLYQSPVATPFKPVLSTEEKVAGLSLFWAEARRHFVHFDHVPDLDWNQTYMAYLSKVIAARTTRDYYRVMMQLAPLLQDGHTNIYAPKELAKEFYARPPLRTQLIEDKVLVSYIGNPSLAEHLHVGDEIVTIDGEPVKQYGARQVAPFVSASTPQDRAQRTYGNQLLMGDEAKPVKLGLRSADGAERSEVLQRSGAFEGPRRFEFKMLPGGIAYFAIDHFESKEPVDMFEMVLPEILKAKALILDVRRNGGGSSDFGYAILSYLSHNPVPEAISRVRADDAVTRAHGQPNIIWSQPLFDSDSSYKHAHADIFSGPVAVLTSAETFSAAEDFTVAFQLMKRGLIVGEATGGSTGQPLFIDLPGGGKGRICVKRDMYPDGSAFVGKGIQPDIEAHPTVAAVRAGADPVLERAVAELRQP